MTSVVRKWKSFYIGKKFKTKYGKLLQENVNCWRKVEKLYMLLRKVKDESKMFYSGETFYAKTKEIYKSMSSVARRWQEFLHGKKVL